MNQISFVNYHLSDEGNYIANDRKTLSKQVLCKNFAVITIIILYGFCHFSDEISPNLIWGDNIDVFGKSGLFLSSE